MNDDSIATHMHCHVLSVLLTGPEKKRKKKKIRCGQLFHFPVDFGVTDNRGCNFTDTILTVCA